MIESDFIFLINCEYPKFSRLYKLKYNISLVDGKILLDEFKKSAILIQTPDNMEYTVPISTIRIVFSKDIIDAD